MEAHKLLVWQKKKKKATDEFEKLQDHKINTETVAQSKPSTKHAKLRYTVDRAAISQLQQQNKHMQSHTGT